MGWFTRSVVLTLVDDATGEIFATTKLAPEALPESFEIATTMHIGDAEWSVTQAEPATRAACKKSGAVTLRLRKIETMSAEAIQYSQLDVTERFDDNERLGPNDWISTEPMNLKIPNPETAGLPSPTADPDVVYGIASKMSELREMYPASVCADGVYCPVCHIANVDISKVRAPCPKCGRALLKFGWT